MGSAAGIAVVKAVESGMNVRIIGEQVRNEWQLVTPVSLKDPKQLDGKRVGYHAPITVTEALVKWMAQHYKITPNWMIIPGSDVRAEALMRGQLDATPAEIGDVLNILSAKPGQFHVLISYAKTFPQLIGSMYFARADYVQKNSATVESVLEAILRAHRDAEERPASIKENALRLLPETKPELIEATAAAYKELRIWDVNGGASKDRGDASIKFFEESGLLKKDAVSFKQAFDTAPLDKVLKKSAANRAMKARTLRIISLLTLAAVWEIAGRTGNAHLLPPLSKVVIVWIDLLVSGQLFQALAVSLQALAHWIFYFRACSAYRSDS